MNNKKLHKNAYIENSNRGKRLNVSCVMCDYRYWIKPCHKGKMDTCSKDCARAYKSKQMKGRKITWGDKIGKTNAILLKGHKQLDETKKKRSEIMKKRVEDKIHNWYKHGKSIKSKRKEYSAEWNKNNIEKRREYTQKYRASKVINGGSHTIQEWEEVKNKYNNMCLCCKKKEPEIKLTKDHVLPISLGGSNDISNIQPLCFSCNSIKWATFVDYRNLVNI